MYYLFGLNIRRVEHGGKLVNIEWFLEHAVNWKEKKQFVKTWRKCYGNIH